ncbi:TonB family protein [Acidithiobacillus sp. HP-11]|uniref:TonB family protein n=1 Tax=Acidithiobacillus sp. HP-11 TaxID=2697656 RepID=UPI00187AC0E9|nr:TonB family protein [Acidithiobacillus sp. HP-11]MBE7566418.1 energy transducer TonB [Acidithiobacillus sp. HP-11]
MDQVARGAAASPALPRFQNPHSLAAQEYIAAWIQKTERIGDLNYPGDMTGQLEIRVALNADGSLESVRIVHSSGNSALDRAALRVVRLGAPYAPFSRELLQVTHRLVIRCGMNFLGEKHLSARF